MTVDIVLQVVVSGLLIGLIYALVAVGLWGVVPRGLTGPRWMAALGAALLLLPAAADKAYGYRKDAGALVRQAPADAQWISCGDYFQIIPFRTGRRVVVVAGTGELAYGKDHLPAAERDRWFQEDPAQFLPMALRLRGEDPSRPVYALVDKAWVWKDIPEADRAAFVPVAHSGNSLLVRLR